MAGEDPSDEGSTREGLIQQLGLQQSSAKSLKFGRGVVGKVTVGVLSLMGVLAVVATRIAPGWMLLSVAGLGVVVFLIYLFKVFSFAAKNPAASLLEGGELIQWMEIKAAAKGLRSPPRTAAITDPTKPPPPKALPDLDEDEEVGTTVDSTPSPKPQRPKR